MTEEALACSSAAPVEAKAAENSCAVKEAENSSEARQDGSFLLGLPRFRVPFLAPCRAASSSGAALKCVP